MSVSGISRAICKPAPRSRQITMPVPYHSVFLQALPAAQPTASKYWRTEHQRTVSKYCSWPMHTWVVYFVEQFDRASRDHATEVQNKARRQCFHCEERVLLQSSAHQHEMINRPRSLTLSSIPVKLFHYLHTRTRTHTRIRTRTHTHTHTRLTALCPGLPRWAGTRKVKPIWILLKQETVSGTGINWAICKFAPRSRQITTPASHHSVFYRPDALPAAQPTVSKHFSGS